MIEKRFMPNYQHIVNAAKNIPAERLPLYEHIIDDKIMEKILNRSFSDLIFGDKTDKKAYMQSQIDFFRKMGYDTISFEGCITNVIQQGEALSGRKPGVIQNREDFERYPFEEIANKYFALYGEHFKFLAELLPDGMKAIGGPGNGVFEIAQDFVGYKNLCLLSVDDPELYAALFNRIGDLMLEIWQTFLKKYHHAYCVCRFGDDLGFKTSTLLKPDDIIAHIIPQYKKIIDLVHAYHKPFLLHSCGNIFSVMDEMIDTAGIDAKHSNEDQIAPFSVWLQKYGHRIGNFGGVDVDILCQNNEKAIRDYVLDIIKAAENHKGFALGSGNSIPAYVPVSGYSAMVETVRTFRME